MRTPLRPWLPSLGIFTFTVLWFGLFSLLGYDAHHGGVMLKPAVDVAAGKALFRDSFCQYGILTPFLQGAAVKLCGNEMRVINLLTVVFYGGVAVALDALWKRFLTPLYRGVVLVLFVGLAPFYLVTFHPWSSVYALFFMLLSQMALLAFLDRRHGPLLWWAGVAAGLAGSCRTPCGAVTVLAALLTLGVAGCRTREYRKTGVAALNYLAGAAIPLVLTVIYLAATGGFPDYLRQCFGFVTTFAVERGNAGNPLQILSIFFPVFSTLWILDVLYAVLPCLALGWLWRLIFHPKTAGTDDLPLISVLIFALGAWHQYYPVPCLRHLYWGAIPLFGVYALCLARIAASARPKWQRGVVLLPLILLALIPIGYRSNAGRERLAGLAQREISVQPGIRGLWLLPSEKKLAEEPLTLFRQLPPELQRRGLFNATADGLFSVLYPDSGFRHPMFVDWGRDVYANYPEQQAAFLEQARPAVFTTADHILRPDYIRVAAWQLRGSVYYLDLPRRK